MTMNKSKKIATHHRSKYVDHSLRFVNWVDSLGLEKTWFGHFASRMDERFRLRKLSLVFLFSLLLSFLLFVDFDLHYQARVGEIATSDIVSPLAFEFAD